MHIAKKGTKFFEMKMTVKALETRQHKSGASNLFVHFSCEEIEDPIFAFVKDNGDFLRYSSLVEWEKAITRWEKPVIEKDFPYDIFPQIRRDRLGKGFGLEYRYYAPDHPKFGKLEVVRYTEEFKQGYTQYQYSRNLTLREVVDLRFYGGQEFCKEELKQIKKESEAGYLQIWFAAKDRKSPHRYMSRYQAALYFNTDETYAYQADPVHITMYGMNEDQVYEWVFRGAEIVTEPEEGSVDIRRLWE